MEPEHLDLTNEPDPATGADRAPGLRRFVGIHFACCGVYRRVYTNRAGTAYVGHCPRCSRRVQLLIGDDGVDDRFFTVY